MFPLVIVGILFFGAVALVGEPVKPPPPKPKK